MSSFTELISNPLFWKILICYWVFSAAIGAMPTPKTDGSLFYQFVFRFGHILSGNVNRAAVALKVPGASNDPTT